MSGIYPVYIKLAVSPSTSFQFLKLYILFVKPYNNRCNTTPFVLQNHFGVAVTEIEGHAKLPISIKVWLTLTVSPGLHWKRQSYFSPCWGWPGSLDCLQSMKTPRCLHGFSLFSTHYRYVYIHYNIPIYINLKQAICKDMLHTYFLQWLYISISQWQWVVRKCVHLLL